MCSGPQKGASSHLLSHHLSSFVTYSIISNASPDLITDSKLKNSFYRPTIPFSTILMVSNVVVSIAVYVFDYHELYIAFHEKRLGP